MFGGGLIEGGLWIFFFFWMVSPILMTNCEGLWRSSMAWRLYAYRGQLGFYVGDGLTVCRL